MSIFGSLTPLIVTEAMLLRSAYVGVYVAIATLPGLAVLYRFTATTHHEPMQSS
ncbi:hypothetical protein [Vibrio coralliilyticus]|uniref:hypothetical protein n=1 Tax=Vibrio coralliilyticus TaxID=190893 RepID=UPI000A609FF1|nr:hypothetical protein [Vibrio coralliilyticus]